MTKIGLEIVQEKNALTKDWGKCGLICNQASLTKDYKHAVEVLHGILGPKLLAIFGPQHGFFGHDQDNMIETQHTKDEKTGLPIYSLYSETRSPTSQMLEQIDTLIIDLQIVGCRIYTFKATIFECLKMAKKLDKRVVVLDRINPVGGSLVEGRGVDPDCLSFVGPQNIPMRHGLTAAEAALFFNLEVGAKLEVVALENWDAKKDYLATKRPWVITSPNLPTLEPVFVYPGTVIFEGTNVSEGRGTSLPFQYLGAPYIKNSEKLLQRIKDLNTPTSGVYLRPASFKPTFHKHGGKVCQGLQIHVQDSEKVQTYGLALGILKAFMDLGEEQFQWKEPPYEYEYKKLPMEIILGSTQFQKHMNEKEFWRSEFWNFGVTEFIGKAKKILLYDRKLISWG